MLTAGGVAYGYDASGNQTSRGTDTFAYDHENRLTQSVIGGATSSSVYNGDGLRMSHTVSGQPTNYTWDINSGMPLVLQDGTNTYVYGLDLISATDGTGAQTYFTYDGLGSTTDLTDGTGNVIGTYSYDVFGAIRSQTGNSPNLWLFTGEQRDADSGLYFLRARYYDPGTGRFLGQDPLRGSLRHPSTQNRYAYVTNNPTNLVDPAGLCPICNFLIDVLVNNPMLLPPGTGVILCHTDPDCLEDLTTVVGFADTLPWPPIIGVPLDMYAYILAQIQIYRSGCPVEPLSANNAFNLAIGLIGNWVKRWKILTGLLELGSYTSGGIGTLGSCSTAWATGTPGFSKEGGFAGGGAGGGTVGGW